MSEILLREKEFLKLNEELNVKTKILLEKPLVSKENRTVAITRHGNGDHKNESKEISHSPRITEFDHLNGSNKMGKPPIKPRVTPNAAHTVPRNYKQKPMISDRNNAKLKAEEEVNLKTFRTTKENNTACEINNNVAKSKTGNISVYEVYRNRNFENINSVDEKSTKSEVDEDDAEVIPLGTRKDSKGSVASSVKKSSSQYSLPSTNERLPKKTLSSEGLIKFLKSKVTILQDELETSSTEQTKKTESLVKSLEIQKRLESQRDQAISKNNLLTGQMTKLEKNLTDLEEKLKERDTEFTITTRDMDFLKREMRLLTQTNTNLEKRLYRANEELENSKNNLATIRDADREIQDTMRKEKDEHDRQVKTLKKQRTELMTAYKKQLYLLDNLKRQNICLEQARLISFAEREFTKVLEWNDKQ